MVSPNRLISPKRVTGRQAGVSTVQMVSYTLISGKAIQKSLVSVDVHSLKGKSRV